MLAEKEARLNDYAHSGHKLVQGWMSREDIALFQQLAQFQVKHNIAGNLCEIGVHHGKRFLLLYLSLRAGEHAVAIDLFEQQELNTDGSGAGDKHQFLNNLNTHADGISNLTIISQDSATITSGGIRAAAGGAIRLFSVDGSHTADMTVNDMTLACDSLAPGGTIILDDYYNEMWPGVAEGACRAFHDGVFALHGIVPYALFSSKVLFCHANHAILYQEHLAKSFTVAGHRHRTLFGSPVLGFYAYPKSLQSRLRRSRFAALLKETYIGRSIRQLLRP
jgi:hypothetical protein